MTPYHILFYPWFHFFQESQMLRTRHSTQGHLSTRKKSYSQSLNGYISKKEWGGRFNLRLNPKFDIWSIYSPSRHPGCTRTVLRLNRPYQIWAPFSYKGSILRTRELLYVMRRCNRFPNPVNSEMSWWPNFRTNSCYKMSYNCDPNYFSPSKEISVLRKDISFHNTQRFISV